MLKARKDKLREEQKDCKNETKIFYLIYIPLQIPHVFSTDNFLLLLGSYTIQVWLAKE